MPRLVKCSEHDEVFVIEEGKKCWIQDPDTFSYLGYRWEDVEVIPFEELRRYPVGLTKIVKTVKEIREGKKPRDIFYPTKEENPYRWIRGLLTLGPKPSTQKAFELGFNLILPFANLPSSWVAKGGKVIPNTKTIRADETGIVAYSTCDEPDCHKHCPYSELELVKEMKKKTAMPVGTILCDDIGCGVVGTASSKEEYKRQWIEVLNQMDFIMLTVYSYRKPEVQGGRNPVEQSEWFLKFYKENITVPILPIIQAHQGHSDQIKPDPMEQIKFWVSKGYGYVVYPWEDLGEPIGGVRDMQEEWRLANEWAASQI